MKHRIDLDELSRAIRAMRRYDSLYKVLKVELTELDHWKDKGRGDPVKAHSMIGQSNYKDEKE